MKIPPYDEARWRAAALSAGGGGIQMPDDRPTPEDRLAVRDVRRQVIVKYKDSVVLPPEGRRSHGESLAVPGWSEWIVAFPGLVNRRLFEQPLDVLEKLAIRAHQSDPLYDPVRLGNYIAIELPAGVAPGAVAKLVRLHDAVDKQKTYVDPPPVEPPTAEPEDDPLRAHQGYLKPARQGGVDAEYAQGIEGGGGEGQFLVDIEWGWTLDHEDLVDHAPQRISGRNDSFFYHGAAVLGIIAAVNNDVGCIGIAPRIRSIRWASPWRDDGRYSVPNAVTDATLDMARGQVMLLELQTTQEDRQGFPESVPVEVLPAVFDAVRIATALEIVVVEAAGNGNVNLDRLEDDGRFPLRPGGPGFRNSGAILVAAGTSTAPHVRIPTSCYGARVDCFAWGQNVFSLTADWKNRHKNRYGSDVGRTSSAAAIVAGVALAVQGLAEVHLEDIFGARELRDILKRYGTPAAAATEPIGVMPDLFKIIQGVIPTPASDY